MKPETFFWDKDKEASLKISIMRPGTVAHACYLKHWEAEAGGWGVQCKPELYSKVLSQKPRARM